MKISVVTVCYNAVQTLEKTMLSVLNQTYPDIEYIIIDGGSTDGTVDIIKKYADRLAYWVSEPDKGIYDAMNKGIKVATGEWINFMNAGDRFATNDVTKKLFTEEDVNNYACVFGDTIFTFLYGEKIIKYGDSASHKIMPSCHQSIFCKRELLLTYPFDLNYKMAADFDFFYKLWQLGVKYKYIDMIVAVYDASNGISSKNIKQTRKELLQISNPAILYYIKYLFFLLKYRIKKVLNYCSIRR